MGYLSEKEIMDLLNTVERKYHTQAQKPLTTRDKKYAVFGVFYTRDLRKKFLNLLDSKYKQ